MSTQTWDRGITIKTSGSTQGHYYFGLNLPVELSRALQARGYDRVVIELTDAGILLRPYVSGIDRSKRPPSVADLPETWA